MIHEFVSMCVLEIWLYLEAYFVHQVNTSRNFWRILQNITMSDRSLSKKLMATDDTFPFSHILWKEVMLSKSFLHVFFDNSPMSPMRTSNRKFEMIFKKSWYALNTVGIRHWRLFSNIFLFACFFSWLFNAIQLIFNLLYELHVRMISQLSFQRPLLQSLQTSDVVTRTHFYDLKWRLTDRFFSSFRCSCPLSNFYTK